MNGPVENIPVQEMRMSATLPGLHGRVAVLIVEKENNGGTGILKLRQTARE